MERDIPKEIELLVASQLLLAKNVNTWAETFTAGLDAMKERQEAFDASLHTLKESHADLWKIVADLAVAQTGMSQALTALLATVDAYIKGLRNGH